MTYGVECDVCYKPSDPDHVRRKHKVYNDVAGRQMLPSRFRPIVAKVSANELGKKIIMIYHANDSYKERRSEGN